ncbi:Chemotaxis protein CheV OS=Stutzerimonas stutzeri OX=316 GN=CXK95_07275 PE=4 SV=1 [Stutzerimonas stutzeri]
MHGLHVQSVARLVSCATSKILPSPYGAEGRSFSHRHRRGGWRADTGAGYRSLLHNVSASAEADLSDLDVEDARL